MTTPRLKGQEISVRVVNSGVVVSTLDSISSLNEEILQEIKEDGFIGEYVNRFDEIFNGYGGDFEMHVTNATWNDFTKSVTDRAQRKVLGTTFNVVVTDLYADGSSAISTYVDVSWGGFPRSVGSRGDFAKVKASFKCSEKSTQVNALP